MDMHKPIRINLPLALALIPGLLFAGDINYSAFSGEKDKTTLTENKTTAKAQFENDKKNEDSALIYAKHIHDYATVNKEHKVKKDLKKLSSLSKSFPGNMQIQAYHGSLTCMSARDTWFIPSKMSRVKSCIKLLDSAVKKDASNPAVLGIRAGNSINLPERFKRRPVAIDDINKMLTILKQNPTEDSDGFSARLLTQLVVLYGDQKNIELQQDAYSRLEKTTTDSTLIAIAQEALI